MTQSSILWTNNSTGDGVSGGYTQAQHIEWMRALFAKSNGGGVSANYLNELAVTGTSSPVAVNTGAAVVYGFIYFNGASENIVVPTPSSATRIDRIVLRADWTAQTVRIARVAGSEGGGAPSLTQTPSTTWEVPLAQVSITTLGNITLTDQREYIAGVGDGQITAIKLANDAVETSKIDDDAVTGDKIGVQGFYLPYRKGGDATSWNVGGAATYAITNKVRVYCGVIEIPVSGGGGSTTITLPGSYAAFPYVIASQCGSLSKVYVSVAASSANQITIYVEDDGSITGDVAISWMTIGPE